MKPQNVKPQNILITGGSGLIGRKLTTLLLAKGHRVSWLSRSGKSMSGVKAYRWDIEKMTIDKQAFASTEVIIHLAGEGIANRRWTTKQKKRIFDSRVQSTRLLRNALGNGVNTTNPIKRMISASAIGYYGVDSGDELLTEDDQPGSDFLANVTKQWEEEVDKIGALSIDVAKLRIGIVLSSKAGALEKISQPIGWGMGAALGTGDQYMSWIHVNDLCRMIDYLLDNSLSGVYNAVAADTVTNTEMTKAIAQQLNKPCWLPNVPAFVLKILLGEMSDLLLGSSKVSSEKIQEEGFVFDFPTLKPALENLLG